MAGDEGMAFRWREGVVPVEVDGELLVLDADAGRVVRLTGVARAAVERHRSVRPTGLPSDTPGVVDVLAGLGLTEERLPAADRRAVLRAGGLAALGVSVLALPSAAAAATGGAGGGDGLYATGSGDETFTTAGAPNSTVYAIQTMSDGRIVIGGEFTSVGGQTRGRLARLHANGTLDTSFANPGFASGLVLDLDVDGDGSVVVGGTTGIVIRRVHANGTSDASFVVSNVYQQFSVGAQGVEAVAIDAAGGIYVGGQFTHIAGEPRRGMARLHANGALDTAFADAQLDGWVYSLRVRGNTVVAGGGFTTTSAGARGRVARFHPNGAVDTSFANPAANDLVRKVDIDASGRVVIAGSFSSLGGNTSYGKVARLHPNGAVDTAFLPPAISGSNGDVRAVLIQDDGRVVIGGRFTTVGGTTRNFIARLEANGAPEGDFDLNANGSVWGLAFDASGRILVGGVFTAIGGIARSYLARIG